MRKPFISIVATFYNQARYIPRLIKSVINQTFENWELICVNDCSPGKDKKILEKWASSPKSKGRIRVINNATNQKVSKSRHIGIANATGEYLTFIDGDDWLEKDALSVLASAVKENNLDMAVMNAHRAIPYTNIKKDAIYIPRQGIVIESPIIMDDYFNSFMGVQYFIPTYYAKLIRTDLVKKCDFQPTERYYCEDEEFLIHLWPMLNRIMFLRYSGYCWRWGSGVTSSNIGAERIHYVLESAIDYYKIKKEIIYKTNYFKGERSLIIELKNTLIGCIDARYKPNNIKAKNEIEYIKTILDNEVFGDINILIDKYDGKNSIVNKAIISKDAEKIYSIAYERYKKTKFKSKIYDYLGTIIRYIP